jgi:hypothetical protein
MIWRKFLKRTFLALVSCAILNEIALFVIKNPNAVAFRHNVDLYANFPPKTSDIDTDIVLGDSVVNQVFESFNIRSGIVDLTTNQATGLSGNYFLLKRFLRENAAPKRIWLSFTPTVFAKDMSDDLSYTYFFSVFNRPEEINESLECGISKAGYNLSLNYKIKHRFDLFASPWIAFNFFSQRWIKALQRVDAGSAISYPERRPGGGGWVRKYEEVANIHPIARCFMEKVARLGKDHGFHVSIVINPFYQRKFSAASLNELKSSLGVFGRIADMNESAVYDEGAFYDGTHLINQYRYIFYRDLFSLISE